MFLLDPGCHEVQSELSYFFWSLYKGMMWWYNILRDNKVSISHILQHDHISSGYILIAANLIILKRYNPEPILAFEIIEWRKFIDYFGLSTEADPSNVKKYRFFPYRLYTNPFIWIYPYRKSPYGKGVEFEKPKLCIYQ